MARRIQHLNMSTHNDGQVMYSSPFALAGIASVEAKLLIKLQAAHDNGYDPTAVLLWLPLACDVQPDAPEEYRGKYGFDVPARKRRDANPALDQLANELPWLIERVQRVHRKEVICYCPSPRLTYGLVEAREKPGREARAAYRKLCRDNMAPYAGAQIALDAMGTAWQSWDREIGAIEWWTGQPVIVEGQPDPICWWLDDCSSIVMQRSRGERWTIPTTEWASGPWPEKIAWYAADADWQGRDRRMAVAEMEAMGVSVCCDWGAV